jgi:hypothetical protein
MKPIKFQIIVSCKGGKCPVIYRTNDGRFFVQGYKVASDLKSQVALSKDENLVEVPKSLLQSMISKQDELL